MPKHYQPFKFKQFEVAQDKCAMKVGTDGVLLGAWALAEGERILDVGTGTGLIALMQAQKNPNAKINAIEINVEAVEQAEKNFIRSPWSKNLSAFHVDLQNFKPDHQYDLIISNPPYFIKSTPAPKADRLKARHTVELTFEDLILAAESLLKQQGKISIILPYKEGLDFINLAQEKSFYPERITEFHSRQNKPVERLLMTLSRKKVPVKQDQLIHYKENNEWSEAYKKLTKDFYIIL